MAVLKTDLVPVFAYSASRGVRGIYRLNPSVLVSLDVNLAALLFKYLDAPACVRMDSIQELVALFVQSRLSVAPRPQRLFRSFLFYGFGKL